VEFNFRMLDALSHEPVVVEMIYTGSINYRGVPIFLHSFN